MVMVMPMLMPESPGVLIAAAPAAPAVAIALVLDCVATAGVVLGASAPAVAPLVCSGGVFGAALQATKILAEITANLGSLQTLQKYRGIRLRITAELRPYVDA
jgi:hypothetical protein